MAVEEGQAAEDQADDVSSKHIRTQLHHTRTAPEGKYKGKMKDFPHPTPAVFFSIPALSCKIVSFEQALS